MTPATLHTDFLDIARDLGPLIAAHRAKGDELRRLPDEVAQAFVERDLFRILLPPDLGGAGADPLTYAQISEELSYHDGSSGWNFTIGSGTMVLAGHLPLSAARTMFAGPDACIAGGLAPGGRATAVDGGLRVSGRWAWGSGMHHATWAIATCIMMSDGKPQMDEGGLPVMRQIIVPKAEVLVLDTWHVGGMRGTGSTEYTMEDVFVPNERVFQAFRSQRYHEAPIFRVPSSFFGVAVATVPLGIARAALDGLINLAVGKASMFTRSKLKDHPTVQYDVARSQAVLESAREYHYAGIASMWEATVRGDEISMEHRARIRRGTVHAAEAAAQVIDTCYRAAGGSALSVDNPFERSLRDAHAVLGHIVVQRAMMEDAGRVTLGLPPLTPIF